MATIFNKNAFKIQGKIIDPIKFLDGGFNVTLVIKEWEMGQPKTTRYEIIKDCMGHIQVDSNV